MLSLQLYLKISFNLQYGKFPSIVRLSLALKSSEASPKYGKTQINSLLEKFQFPYESSHSWIIVWNIVWNSLLGKFQFPYESSHNWSIVWNYCEVKFKLTHVCVYLV